MSREHDKAETLRLRRLEREDNRRKETEILRQTPIREVLVHLGLDATPDRTAGRGMFRSPFREESKGSFHIDEQRNLWYDHGTGEGGDVFDLVLRVRNCDFREACSTLRSLHPELPGIDASTREDVLRRLESQTPADYTPSGTRRESSAFIIKETRNPFTKERLVDYFVNEREIPRNILEAVCDEVYYAYANNPDTVYYGAGFRNIDGDLALRNSLASGKKSTGQNISCISADGENLLADSLDAMSSPGVIVFEGFTDYMSYLAWTDRTSPQKADAIILNSVNNLPKALDLLSSYDRVVAYLDNDAAGTKATDAIREHLQKVSESRPDHPAVFLDGRVKYNARDEDGRFIHGDLNDAWIHEARTRRQRQREAVSRAMKEEQARAQEEKPAPVPKKKRTESGVKMGRR